MPRVLVLGGNFGGLTAALSIKDRLQSDVDVTVVSASDRFLFNPSLIWMPFGRRTAKQITFPLEPTYTEAGVEFIHAAAEKIDPDRKTVTARGTEYNYDYLVIATGYRNDFDVVPGLGPSGHASTITTLADAERAADAWTRFLKKPGDVVIAATQGAGCFGAAYEFLFNARYQLKKAGLTGKVKMTYVTSEPFLGHFGIGGMPGAEGMVKLFLKKDRIDHVTNMALEYVDKDVVKLADGRTLPYAYAMIVPPFLGQDVVRDTPRIGDAKGYAPVRNTYQTRQFDDVYAVGIAAGIPLPWTTPTPTGMPKTGFPTEQMAHVAAHNIVRQIQGKPADEEKAFGDIPAVCVMDAGNNGVLILGTGMLPPRKAAVMIPGPQNHAFKLAFEKYYLWKMRTGHVNLP